MAARGAQALGPQAELAGLRDPPAVSGDTARVREAPEADRGPVRERQGALASRGVRPERADQVPEGLAALAVDSRPVKGQADQQAAVPVDLLVDQVPDFRAAPDMARESADLAVALQQVRVAGQGAALPVAPARMSVELV